MVKKNTGKIIKDTKPDSQDELALELERRVHYYNEKFLKNLEIHSRKIQIIEQFDPSQIEVIHSCEYPECSLSHNGITQSGSVKDLSVWTFTVKADVDDKTAFEKISVNDPKMYSWFKSSRDSKNFKLNTDSAEKIYGSILCIDCKKIIERELLDEWINGFIDANKGNEIEARKAFKLDGPFLKPHSNRVAYNVLNKEREKSSKRGVVRRNNIRGAMKY